MSQLVSDLAELAPRYDVIVVGSGYGGGIAACRLARAGLKVCVLEQGRYLQPGDFPSTPFEMLRETEFRDGFFRFGSRTSLYELRVGDDIHVLMGRGVGGGSLINAAVAMRPDLTELKARGWPAELTDDPEFAAGFDRAERMLGVTVDTAGDTHRVHAALTRAADALGVLPEDLPTAIVYEQRRNAAGLTQEACQRCGDCWAGCNVGAKTTVAVTYLQDAVANGARIFPQMRVRDVRQLPEGGWSVRVQPIRDSGGIRTRDERMLTAPLVVLAAGALGSPEILMRSRHAGLSLSPRLGEGFSGNGDDLAVFTNTPYRVDGVALGYPPRQTDVGAPGVNTSGMLRVRLEEEERELLLQAGMVPHLLARLEMMRALFSGRLPTAFAMLREGPYDGLRAHMQAFYVVGHDSAGGTMELSRETLRVLWPGVAEEAGHAAADAVIDKLAGQLRARRHPSPFPSGLLRRRKITVHALGGCRIGRHGDDGVVDYRGRVFDPARGGGALHSGLMVVDGSVMPGSLAANPLLTISAFAERAMHLLLAESQSLPVAAP